MTDLLLRNGINLTERWWTMPEYRDGELYLPGQSRLSPEERETLEQINAAAERHELAIPAMPEAAMEASRLLKNADSEIADIADVISRDPGMAAQILRFANSAMYGARFPIDSLDRAVSHLGMRHLQTVVLQIAMNRVGGTIEAKAYARREWRHSLACALISRRLAERLRLDLELCYLAGLLHDIGRLPVISALHKRGHVKSEPAEDSAIEIIVEALHRGVGVQVADAWELPPAIRDAIGNHLTGRMEGEDTQATFPSTKVAEAASDLCYALGEGRFRKPHDVLNSPSFRAIGFRESDIVSFLEVDLPEIVQELDTGA